MLSGYIINEGFPCLISLNTVISLPLSLLHIFGAALDYFSERLRVEHFIPLSGAFLFGVGLILPNTDILKKDCRKNCSKKCL